jgi:predicted RecA/RadA family phage recombinase
MRKYIQPGNTITIPAPDDIEGGEIVAIGGLIGIAASDATTGADLDLVLVGVFDLPKVSTDAITIGAPVYVAGGVVTTDDDSGANPLLGRAVTAAPNPSASVHVRLKG